MDLAKVSGWLSAAGAAVLLAGVAVVVFVRFGGSTEARSLPGGGQSVTMVRTSLWESQHQVAVRVLLAVAVFAVLAAALVRFGGRLGGLVVVVIGGLGVVASLLSVGIFVAPGIGLFAASALTAELARQERSRSDLPPPPRRPVSTSHLT